MMSVHTDENREQSQKHSVYMQKLETLKKTSKSKFQTDPLAHRKGQFDIFCGSFDMDVTLNPQKCSLATLLHRNNN